MTKNFLCLFSFIFISSSSFASVQLKNIQVSGGNRVDLLFDDKISEKQIKLEYQNDIVQFTIQGGTVYPAKISHVNGTTLSKIFAYQYTPDQVRARFTVNKKAELFQNTLKWKVQGQSLRIDFDTQASAPIEKAGGVPSSKKQNNSKQLTDEEKDLLNKISASSDQAVVTAAAPQKHINEKKADTKTPPVAIESDKILDQENVANDGLSFLHTNKKKSSGLLKKGSMMAQFFKVIGALLGVLLLFAFSLMVLQKLRKKQGFSQATGAGDKKGISQFLSRIPGIKMGGDKMIEVVANQYLGPKKSVSVVRVAGRLLVLGVTPEAINLISEFEDEEEADTLSSSDRTRAFSDSLLNQNVTQEYPNAKIKSPILMGANTQEPSVFDRALSQQQNRESFRKQIRSKLEGTRL